MPLSTQQKQHAKAWAGNIRATLATGLASSAALESDSFRDSAGHCLKLRELRAVTYIHNGDKANAEKWVTKWHHMALDQLSNLMDRVESGEATPVRGIDRHGSVRFTKNSQEEPMLKFADCIKSKYELLQTYLSRVQKDQ
jgi:hypothetical protein